MGNASRKNAPWPSASDAASAVISCDSSKHSEPARVDSDEDEGNESTDDEEISRWRDRIRSARNSRGEQHQCLHEMETRRSSSTYPSTSNCQQSDGRGKPRCKPRSKSIMVKKSTKKCPIQSTSLRSRRCSDSPTQSQSGDQLQLTAAQMNLVRKLWQNVRAQGENGAGITILREHLFFRCPEARRMFATDLKGTQSETAYHRRLITHAETLSEVLDELVTNLERVNVVSDRLKHLGRLHARIQCIGFANAMWDRFAEALNECTSTWCRKQKCFDAQIAWTTIVLYITEQLKDGYSDECRRLRRCSQGQSQKPD